MASLQRYSDRRVLITGGGSGIGQATALRILDEGGRVVAADISESGLKDTIAKAEPHGDRLTTVVMDVGAEQSVRDGVAHAVQALGGLDTLVNVAGIAVMDPNVADTVVTLTEEWFDRVIAVNLKGSWLGMRAVIPHLQAGGGGRIVNISSLAATMGVPAMTAYSASKGGIEALTRQAAADYGPHNILINAVSPGVTKTPLLAAQSEEFKQANAAKHMIDRLGEPAEIASMVAYLLTEGSFATAAVIDVGNNLST